METTTLSVKVSADFARKFREFCDAHALQVGKFTELSLSGLMEDYYFGMKAQRVLSVSDGKATSHQKAFRKRAHPK